MSHFINYFCVMRFTVSIQDKFNCDLERAFKTPMLCDVTKVHTGYGLMPKIISVSDDQNWGQPGSSKKVFAAASLTQKGGYVSKDNVIDRKENDYWVIEVNDFQSWMLGFYKFQGTWKTEEISQNNILITYTYSLFSNAPLLYPFNWLFTQLFWKRYMKRAMKNVKEMAYSKEPYLYP